MAARSPFRHWSELDGRIWLQFYWRFRNSPTNPLSQMAYDPADGVKWYLVFLFSTCCHEAAHAWSAYRLGDDTARGQISLNPWPHIQRAPLGMVVVPLLSYFLGGWMIGWATTPYSAQWALRHPPRAALMALAGPVANVTLLLLAAVLMRVGIEWGMFRPHSHSSYLNLIATAGDPNGLGAFCAKFLSLFFSLNLLLAAFNLLPAPPLDGSRLPLFFLRGGMAEKYWLALQSPIFSWGGLFVAWKLFGAFYPSLFAFASKVLYMLISLR